MPNVQQVKHRMRNYSRDNGLAYARMNLDSPVWGIGARRNAWRITKHATGKASTRKSAVVAVLFPPPLHILHPSYTWNGYPVERTGPPKGIVWHHEAGSGMGPDQIHRYHRDVLGWRGIAYHLYVRLDGKVYAGRPLHTIGGHAKGAGDWLGVCAEGNYDTTRDMPKAQLDALRAVHKYLHRKYGPLPDRRHRDMPSNATACPGRHFPLDKIVA